MGHATKMAMTHCGPPNIGNSWYPNSRAFAGLRMATEGELEAVRDDLARLDSC